MNEGAIVLADCLGYKGIWKEPNNPDDILRQFHQIRERVAAMFGEGIFRMYRDIGFRLRISFLSDTIAIGVDAPAVKALNDDDRGRLLHLACMAAQTTALQFLRMNPPLSVRGVGVLGRFELTDQFLIGPAVDEAAELHEMADGAFIWIPPHYTHCIAAARNGAEHRIRQGVGSDEVLNLIQGVLQSFGGNELITRNVQKLTTAPPEVRELVAKFVTDLLTDRESNWNCFHYPVPLKGRGIVNCLAIGTNLPNIAFADVRRLYEMAMASASLDVGIKKQNTLNFLDYSNALTVRSNEKWKERISEVNRALENIP